MGFAISSIPISCQSSAHAYICGNISTRAGTKVKWQIQNTFKNT